MRHLSRRNLNGTSRKVSEGFTNRGGYFMNRRHFARHAFFILCLFIAIACATLFSPKGSSQDKSADFNQEISRSLNRYDRLTLNPVDIEQRVRRTGRFTLDTSAGTFELKLAPHDMRADNYRAVEVLEGGETRTLPREPIRTFKGAVEGVAGSQARFTLDGRTIEGLILMNGEKFYVESASRYSREAATTDFLFYREAASKRSLKKSRRKSRAPNRSRATSSRRPSFRRSVKPRLRPKPTLNTFKLRAAARRRPTAKS
jgi:hypothetical protein